MEIKAFIKKIEDYYGRYSPGVKREVLRYIDSVAPNDLPRIYKQLLLTFSTQYKVQPDVAILEKAREDMIIRPDPAKDFKPALPEPEAKDYSRELGAWFKKLQAKSRMSKKKTREEAQDDFRR
jgi:hypothetical protein